MATEVVPAERLRAYLRDLKPEAQALLVAKLERGALQGVQIPGADLILQELRPALRRAVQRLDRIPSPARLFFKPVEPFLVDAAYGRILLGRIERTSLAPLWDWLCRDVLPQHAKIYSDRVTEKLLRGDEGAAATLASTLQDQAIREIATWLESARSDDRARRRLLGQIGTPRALQEAQTLHQVLSYRDLLWRFAARLPAKIKNLGDEQAGNLVGLLQHTVTDKTEVLLPALILVMNRLATPWQLIRLATKAAESDVAARVLESPYAAAVDTVLAEISVMIEAVREMLRTARVTDALPVLKDIHDAIRGVRSEMDVSGDCPWGRELARLRSCISDVLTVEIENTPGQVRRLLRPRTMKEIEGPSALDLLDVAEAEARIELVDACRRYAGELAINQIAPRVHAELQNYFDTGTPSLLEALRTAGPGERAFRQSQADAAVRFAGKLFGSEYAALLSRAASIAAADRRPAKV
jgi:hypothetical protein